MREVYVPKDEITTHPSGWNGENETFVIISQHEEKSREEITSMELARLAEKGGSFDFLSDPREDIYSITDEESVE